MAGICRSAPVFARRGLAALFKAAAEQQFVIAEYFCTFSGSADLAVLQDNTLLANAFGECEIVRGYDFESFVHRI